MDDLHEPNWTEDIQEAWKKEIERRLEDLEKGHVTLFDADEVLAEAKAIAP